MGAERVWAAAEEGWHLLTLGAEYLEPMLYAWYFGFRWLLAGPEVLLD